MPGRRTWTRWWPVLLVAGLAACGTPPAPRDGGASRRATEGPRSVRAKDLYVDGKVVVAAVDASGLARGEVRIDVRNQTDEFLPDLAYMLTLYYPNRDPDPKKREFLPLIPQTTPKRRLDLDARETATLRTRPEDGLAAGATKVELRLRREEPTGTQVGDTYLSDRLRVAGIDQIGWLSNAPRVKFTVTNDWTSPIRMQFKVQLVKDGKVVSETGWQSAPGVLQPEASSELEADLKGMGIRAGTWPSLKIRRPNI